MRMAYATKLLLIALTLSSLAAISGAYVTQIHASAVLEGEYQGLLTVISLNVTPGNGMVRFGGLTEVNASTLYSAQAAVKYASAYLAANAMNYDFTYTIENTTGDVSGPSGGLAFTLLAISGMEQKPLGQNFSVTGTIQPDGTVGLIGGIYDKIGAAEKGGMGYMLVPAAPGSSIEALLYYLSQQARDIPVVEVGNVSQAIPYAFGNAVPAPLNVNFSQSYNVSGIADSNITCAQCNTSMFGTLVNETLNFTGAYITNMSGNFGSARSLNMPTPGERVLGDHAVVAVGYDDSTNRLIVRNSWGKKFGLGGYFTMPYAYLLKEDLSADFWNIKVVGP